MAHPKFTVDTFGGSTQATVEGLLQLTLLADGTVEINLANTQVEVERMGTRYIVRPSTLDLVPYDPSPQAAEWAL
jgi:hypothetical protein